MIRTTRLWDVIVKYSGPESGLAGDGNRGSAAARQVMRVVTLPESEIDAYSNREQIEFIEKPKRLYFETFRGESRRAAYCLCRHGNDGLTGEEILVGCCGFRSGLFSPGFQK